MDLETRRHQQLCARAERAGYDGDVADLYPTDPYYDAEPDDEYDDLESPALICAAAGLLLVALFLGLVVLPAVRR